MTVCSAIFEEEYAEVERTTDVLADQLELIGAYSKEQEDHLAEAWEGTHGRPLMRSYETVPQFRERQSKFSSTVEPKSYFMDRASARQALDRLRKVEKPSKGQKAEINDLETLLDERPTNFSAKKVDPADAQKESVERYLRIQTEEATKDGKKRERRPWQDRLALTKQEADAGVLQLLITQDDHEEVRAAAERRLAELEVTGR